MMTTLKKSKLWFEFCLLFLCLCTSCSTNPTVLKQFTLKIPLLFAISPITIYGDGRSLTIHSTSNVPREWILQSGFQLTPEDEVWLNGWKCNLDEAVVQASAMSLNKIPLATAYHLQIRRAQLIQLDDGGKLLTFRSAETTLLSALLAQHVEIYQGDQLTPTGDTLLNTPLQVKLTHSQQINIQYNGQTLSTRSTAIKVSDALLQAAVPLQGWDISDPPLDAPLPADGIIFVTHINEQLTLDYVLTPYKTERQALPELEAGQQKIIQEGAQGVSVQSMRTRYAREESIYQYSSSRWTAREVQTRVLGVGSKLIPKTLDIPGGQITYWQIITMYATSYSPCRLGVPNRCNYTTATGARLQKGVVAVTRDDFALFGNAQLYISGYGFATVADIGGGIPGKRWIDLGYGEDDYQPWSKDVTVYIIASVEDGGK